MPYRLWEVVFDDYVRLIERKEKFRALYDSQRGSGTCTCFSSLTLRIKSIRIRAFIARSCRTIICDFIIVLRLHLALHSFISVGFCWHLGRYDNLERIVEDALARNDSLMLNQARNLIIPRLRNFRAAKVLISSRICLSVVNVIDFADPQ